MATFKVRCFDAGIVDGNGFQQVEADDPRTAAEKACGCKVRGDSGKPGELCAEVLHKVAGSPLVRRMYYKNQNSN